MFATFGGLIDAVNFFVPLIVAILHGILVVFVMVAVLTMLAVAALLFAADKDHPSYMLYARIATFGLFAAMLLGIYAIY